MIRKYLVLGILIFNSYLFGQQQFSVHKYHKDLFGSKLPELKKSAEQPGIIPLNTAKKKNISTAVFGYLPDWEVLNGSHQYLRYDLLTHIALFDFGVDKYGNVSTPYGWPELWGEIINKAHENGVKVILTAVKFGGTLTSNSDIHHLLTDAAARENFFSQVISIMKTYYLDGINIDFETYNSADEGIVTTNFMKALKARIDTEIPGAEVSFATPIVNWDDDYDLEGLVEAIDYAFIMAYDFNGRWSTATGAGSPLDMITTYLNSDYGTIINATPEKLILGVPYYGLHWRTFSNQPHTTKIDTFLSSPRFKSAEEQARIYGINWDNGSETPWFYWDDGGWNQIWYDNDSSLGLKYDLAMSKGFKGVGMWALGYDGDRSELWNLIDYKFVSGQAPPPLAPESFYALNMEGSSVFLGFDKPEWSQGFEIMTSQNSVDNFLMYGINLDNNVTLESLTENEIYYYKVAAFNAAGKSNFTEVLASAPTSHETDVLIVNGFDRISGTNNTSDYIKQYALPVVGNSYNFSSASNEAVFNGRIILGDFDIVIWILGDESTADETFNIYEQSIIKIYLQNGGNMFVTGSEIGWDLSEKGSSYDKNFYSGFLKSVYINDSPTGASGTYYSAEGLPNTIFADLPSFGFDDGTHGTFDVDYPDAIRAAENARNILKFSSVAETMGYAGISYEGIFEGGNKPGKLVYLSIPFETIYPDDVRIEIMRRVLSFLDNSTAVYDNYQPDDFVILGNYPNPFNPSTTIEYKLGSEAHVDLKIYNVIGELVDQLVNKLQSPGVYKVIWNAHDFSSGMYICQITIDGNSVAKVLRKKMMLLK
ncbi:MAG: T9SS type A sorting domain-containing protein [Melioribacteraceae bacterium]|nr:T9SS type A sorting domain-containing protein [Melioribacteraceae bacterium]